jgi:hypothetical protein
MGLDLDDIVTQRSLRDALSHYVSRQLEPNTPAQTPVGKR